MNSDSPPNPANRGFPRTIGAFLVLVGAGFLYWSAWIPIERARQHSGHVYTHPKITIAAAILMGVGLLNLVFGNRLRPMLFPQGKESKIPAIVILVLLVVAGIGVYQALESYLATLGYKF